MPSVSFEVGNIVPFPGRKKVTPPPYARQKTDLRAFLDLVHSCKVLEIAPDDQIARAHAIHFCILGFIEISGERDQDEFMVLKPSEAFQNKETKQVWQVRARRSRAYISLSGDLDFATA